MRQARAEAGLSLAGVAGGELSRAAIHLIEAGRSRPSPRTLELIASRTGKPISFFTDQDEPALRQGTLQAKLDSAEAQLELENYEEAATEAVQAAAAATETWDSARANYLLGKCRVYLMQPEEAAGPLNVALKLYGELGDRWMVVECKQWLSKSMFQLEQPAALELAQAALAECRGLDPVPLATEAHLLEHIATIHGLKHEWNLAVETYQQAIAASGSLRDLGRMARMYDNLNVAYQELGNLAAAAACSRKALSLFSIEHDQRALARAENNLGLVLMKQGQFDAAQLHLEKALDLCGQLHLERGRAHVLLSLAELQLAKGNFESARSFTAEAAELSHRLDERMTEALAHQMLGELAAHLDDTQSCDGEFATAFSLLEQTAAPERLLECHVAYARVLTRRGETQRALEQWEAALGASRPHLTSQRSLPFLMVG